jgi:predicted phosphodiesterase
MSIPVDSPEVDLTTVADDQAVAHAGSAVQTLDDLAPGTAYDFDGLAFRTLPGLGERLATFATVNDVHFGETVCGFIEGAEAGPVFRAEPGDPPYPEAMNAAAVSEIARLAPDVVIAKGDLTSDGTQAQYDRFLAVYGGAFRERLVHVRGNHEAYHHHLDRVIPTEPVEVELPGVRLAVLDTTWSGHAGGRIGEADLEWLDELAVRSDRPVLVFGHHPARDPGAGVRPGESFGLQPDDSERLVSLVGRRPTIRGYFAGHTHRNRVRRFAATGDVPWVEVACVKDFPGSWAEYRVSEGGVLQIHRRISSPEALAWSERTRGMFNGHYPRYALGSLDERCFAIRYR